MNYPEKARQVIETEIVELQRLRDRVGENFSAAVERLLACLAAGRKLVICGVGKSGNHRPAGSASALYSAWPVAILQRQPGALDPDPRVMEHVGDVLDTLQ